MSIIWFFMMFCSTILLLFTNPSGVLSEMLLASKSTVELVISLLGIYVVWLGIIEILNQSGLADKLAKLLEKPIRFLFRSKNSEANKYIAINMASNILGLGNAATPSGIKAMNFLDDGSTKANFSATMLLVINSISLQLLPTTVISLRQSAGSSSPDDIILPTIITSLLTATLAISLVFLTSKLHKKRKNK